MIIQVPGIFTYSGAVNDGTQVSGLVDVDVPGLSCGEIVTALDLYQSSDNLYPVECDFVTLSGTGVVFFMDPDTQQLGNSLLVQVPDNSVTISQEDLQYIYTMEVGFVCFVMIVSTLVRNFRKIRNRNFFA